MSYLITPATVAALCFLTGHLHAADDRPLAGVHRIVFLGDSITYSGQFVEFIEAYLNATGHWLIAREILRHWGVQDRAVLEAVNGEQLLSGKPNGLAILKLVQQKQRMLKDAWLTTTGHKRPGMNHGRPLIEAQRRAQGIEAEIDALLDKATLMSVVPGELATGAEPTIHFSGLKKRNNLVSELLSVSSISTPGGSFTFTRPREGWVFISAACKGTGTVKIAVDKATSENTVVGKRY